VTREVIERLKKQGRIADIVSRGGAFLTEWMIVNKKENPLYEQFDRLVSIARKYDMTLSLGDGLRPGSIADATDRCQVQELLILGELCERAQKEGVQVMIEGPGHVPRNQIERTSSSRNSSAKERPFYVLGPIVTRYRSGIRPYHLGNRRALADTTGADFHLLTIPSPSTSGLRPSRCKRRGGGGTHSGPRLATLPVGKQERRRRDEQCPDYRKALDWEGRFRPQSIPTRFRDFRKERKLHDDVCSMCGEGKYCAMKIVTEYFKKD
jgi:phosphomethylpyrimidine synthase